MKVRSILILLKKPTETCCSSRKIKKVSGGKMEFDSNQYDLVLFVLLVISFCVGMFTILFSKKEIINRGILFPIPASQNQSLRIPFDLLVSFGFVSEYQKYRVNYKKETLKIGVVILSESFFLLYKNFGITNDVLVSLVKLVVFASIVIGLWIIIKEYKNEPNENSHGLLKIPDWKIVESILELLKKEKIKIKDWNSFAEYFPFFAYLLPIEKFEKDENFSFTMNFEDLFGINGIDQEAAARMLETVKRTNGLFFKIPFPQKKRSGSKKSKRKR
ncbi:hypothetical protein JWG45_19645 [Leptospira sp. 201903070]|uniref:DUF5673 domain-containing protein n=1 Tax=Leptospira ainlahdjerensis TaxID=2810033 RepID=A0ABS2UIV4_9LEPT|nr:hypothetical protein [Leptospira ainlahdjerensis]MBM9579362.1 hypothetical protein [Leptospira ainlahdjerensis]